MVGGGGWGHFLGKFIMSDLSLMDLENLADLIVFVVWLTDKKHLALFPAGTIVRDPHHPESPTCREQDLHLCRKVLGKVVI